MKHGPAYIRPVTRPSCRTWTFEQATLAAAPTSGQNRCSICRRVIGGGLSGLEQHQRRSLRCLRWRSWYYTHSLQKGKKRRPKYPAACRFGPVGEKFRKEAAIPIASCKADLHLAELLEIQQTFMTPGPANAWWIISGGDFKKEEAEWFVHVIYIYITVKCWYARACII